MDISKVERVSYMVGVTLGGTRPMATAEERAAAVRWASGFVIYEDDDVVVLAQSGATDDAGEAAALFSQQVIVPKSTIVSRHQATFNAPAG